MGWTVLSDAGFDIGEPIKAAQGLGLRDNPIAIANGDTGAPRLQGAAAARAGNGLAVITVAAADTRAASYGMGPVVGTIATTSTSLVVAQTYTVGLYTGTMRFKCSHAISNALASSQLRIRLNGATVDTWDTSSTSLVQRTKDVAVVPGDVIEWLHKTDNGAYTSTVASPLVFADDAYVEQPLYIRASAV